MLLRLMVAVSVAALALRDGLTSRARLGDERGEVTSTTIMIAVLATLALAVGAIIVAKVTSKANSIPTE